MSENANPKTWATTGKAIRMIKRFTKGKLRKELIYTRAKFGEYRNQPHVVSMYPSDSHGRMQLIRDRYEELPSEKRAIELFGKWEEELLEDGWTAEWRNAESSPKKKKDMVALQLHASLRAMEKETDDVEPAPAAEVEVPKEETAELKSEPSTEPISGLSEEPPKEEVSEKVMKEEKTCPICGKTFTAERRNQKYCCRNCSNKAYRQNQKKATQAYLARLKEGKKPFAERICPICGKQFTPSVANQKCCSGICAHERHKLNDRRNYKKKCQAKKAVKNEAPVKEMEKKTMKTGNVLSWYESARYVITEFMNKAETEEDVKFISEAISGCLDNALKDATVRMVIAKRYPMVQETSDAPDVKAEGKGAGE